MQGAGLSGRIDRPDPRLELSGEFHAFRAIRAIQSDSGVTTELVMLDDSDLDVGDVTVRVDCSTINYKDGLAITNASPVIQRFPLIPGIDLAGYGRGFGQRRVRSRRQGGAERLGP